MPGTALRSLHMLIHAVPMLSSQKGYSHLILTDEEIQAKRSNLHKVIALTSGTVI